MASAIKSIIKPEKIKTVLLVGAHFPRTVKEKAPNGPFTFYSGEKVKT